MCRRCAVLSVLAIAALALLGAPGGGAAESGTATASKGKLKRVNIKGFAYRPKTVRVRRGTRVRFKNRDRARHDAVDRGQFSTGTLRRGKARTIRFTKRGTFRYICTFHPFMRGKVVVVR